MPPDEPNTAPHPRARDEPPKRKPGERYTAKQMAAALRANRGLVAPAARAIGCDRGTVDRYIREYPTVRAARDGERETFKDYLESQFILEVEARNWDAIKFGLRTLCGDRGYEELMRGSFSHRHGADPDLPPVRVMRIGEARTREELEALRNGHENGHRQS